MTVGDLKKILENIPDDTLIGAPDEDGTICEILFAGLCYSETGEYQYLLINPNGGYPLRSAHARHI